ncbi:MAG: hypothetical protein PVH38_04015 [Gammaproteobacteria bacterium]
MFGPRHGRLQHGILHQACLDSGNAFDPCHAGQDPLPQLFLYKVATDQGGNKKVRLKPGLVGYPGTPPMTRESPHGMSGPEVAERRNDRRLQPSIFQFADILDAVKGQTKKSNAIGYSRPYPYDIVSWRGQNPAVDNRRIQPVDVLVIGQHIMHVFYRCLHLHDQVDTIYPLRLIDLEFVDMHCVCQRDLQAQQQACAENSYCLHLSKQGLHHTPGTLPGY